MLFKYRIPPLVLAGIVAVMMYANKLYTPSFEMRYILKISLSLVFLFTGLLFVVIGASKFKKYKTTVNPTKPETTSVLITSGIYAITRNPMYVGFTLALLGWGVYLQNSVSILFIAIFFVYMNNVQIPSEEKALNQLFGDRYHKYKSQVRRWL